MRFEKPTWRHSFLGWLGAPSPRQGDAAGQRLQALRAQLIDALPPHARGLAARLRGASGARELWFCRGELMQALAAERGEAAARAALTGLDRHFEGLLPDALLGRDPAGPGRGRPFSASRSGGH